MTARKKQILSLIKEQISALEYRKGEKIYIVRGSRNSNNKLSEEIGELNVHILKLERAFALLDEHWGDKPSC